MVVLKVYGQYSIESVKISPKHSMGDIKTFLAEKMGQNVDYGVFYCGKELDDEEYKILLEKTENFHENSVLFAFRKPKLNLPCSAEPSSAEVDGLLATLQATFGDSAHRSMMVRITNDPETLQNLIDCVPGLRLDTVAQGILRDPYLLLHWIDNENVTDNFIKHPCLFTACQQLVEHMHAELLRHDGLTPADAVLLPALAQDNYMGPDESDDDEDNIPQNMMGYAPTVPPAHVITPQFLAAALAAAANAQPGASGSHASSTNNSGQQREDTLHALQPTSTSSNSSASSTQRQLITREYLAATLAAAAAGGQSAQNQVELQAKVDELKNMGFLDEQENRLALQETNGDVQAAIEFIINEREKRDMQLD